MNDTSSSACEEGNPPLLASPTHSNVERAEVLNPGVREGRRLVCESFHWKVSHNGLNSAERTILHLTQLDLMDRYEERNLGMV